MFNAFRSKPNSSGWSSTAVQWPPSEFDTACRFKFSTRKSSVCSIHQFFCAELCYQSGSAYCSTLLLSNSLQRWAQIQCLGPHLREMLFGRMLLFCSFQYLDVFNFEHFRHSHTSIRCLQCSPQLIRWSCLPGDFRKQFLCWDLLRSIQYIEQQSKMLG